MNAEHAMRRTAIGKVAAILTALTMSLPGCSPREPHRDSPHPRIISHSPAITRILFDMGLGDHLVGVTNWCELPEDYKTLPRVADAHGIRAEAALAVEPELILTQSSDPRMFAGVKQMLPGVKVVHLPIETLNTIADAIRRIGELTGRTDQAEKTLAVWHRNLGIAKLPADSYEPRRAIFLSGFERPFVAGPDTYIDDLITMMQVDNAGRDIPGTQRWRKATVESVLAARPDVLIVKTSPADASRARAFWLTQLDSQGVGDVNIHIVTDDRWLQPGIHVADLATAIRRMLRPEAVGRSAS